MERKMSLQFVSGNAVSDRTAVIYEVVCKDACQHPKKNYLFIVPEQATLQVQRELSAIHPDHVLGNIDVLSFGRLAHKLISEQTGKNTVILDDTGKSMILRRIAGRQRDNLEVFARNLNQSGFIQELKSVISEFSAYRVTKNVLEEILPSLEERPALQKKLKDIEKIYTEFYKELGEEYLTAEEMLEVLARLVPDSEKIKNSTVILDGFTGFTPLQYQVLGEILQYAGNVICAVTEDEDGERKELFAMSCDMKKKLIELAKQKNVTYKESLNSYIHRKRHVSRELEHLERQLYRVPSKKWAGGNEDIHLIIAENPLKELEYVQKKLLELIREGYAYRDIAIVTGDLDIYQDEIKRLFDRTGIPYFIDKKKSLKNHPLIQFIKKTLAVLEEHMSYDSIMAFLRNPYVVYEESDEAWNESGILCDDLDRLDNYLLAGGIRSFSRWKKTWELPYDNTDGAELEKINGLRQTICEWFEPLRKTWNDKNTTVREAMTQLFFFMQKFKIDEKLSMQRKRFHDENEAYLESEYEQVYPKLLALFDQIVELMGDEILEVKVLSDILDSGFEELQVGFIPAAVDRLVVGDLMRTRLNHIKVLFVIGANDKILPKPSQKGGILSDYDREVLKQEGMELSMPAREEVFCQQYYLYLLLTKPSKELYISFCETSADGKALRASHLVSVVDRIFAKCKIEKSEEVYTGINSLMQKDDGFLLLVNAIRNYLDGSNETWWHELYSYYIEERQYDDRLKNMLDGLFYGYKTERLDKELARKLFGRGNEITISRLEKYMSCAYAHFLTYGLGLRERNQFELKAADYGNLFHASISYFFTLLEARHMNWREINSEQRNALVFESVSKAMEEYQTSAFDGSERNKAMAKRIQRMTDRTLWALGYQWEQGGYEQIQHELDFGKNAGNALTLSIEKGLELSLKGRIDRIDYAKDDGSIYVKVIDYKSGGTRFDLAKVYYGLQLQLILYLEAAMDYTARNNPSKEIIPAGVYYYNLKDPIIAGFGLTKEEIEEKQQKELRMNGLTSTEKASLSLIDAQGGKVVAGLEYKKDGSLSSRACVADAKRMHALGKYARKKALELARDIYGGNIDVNPYEHKKRTACEYCEFASICRFDLQTEGCSYKRLSAIDDDTVWERIVEKSGQGEENG